MPTQAHIAGTVAIDGIPAARDIIVIKDDPVGRQVVGSGTSGTDGTFDITYHDWIGPVIAVAIDKYGNSFAALASLNVGAVIHPTQPNGYVYYVTVPGTTGPSEPEWATDESVVSGSVTFNPKPYYRPIVSGPLTGEILVNNPTDEYFNDVIHLLHFDTSSINDIAGATWNVNGSSAGMSSTHSKFGGVSLRVNGKTSDINTSPILAATDSFTVEMFFRIDSTQTGGTNASNWRGSLFSQGGSRGSTDQLLGIIKVSGLNKLRFFRGANLGGSVVLTGTTTVTEDAWHFVQFTYDTVLDKFQIWLDGNLEGEASATSGWVNTTQPVRIGRHTVVGYTSLDAGFDGWIDEVRVTKRSNRPHVIPTNPFPDQGPS